MTKDDRLTLSRRELLGLSGVFVLGMYLPIGRLGAAKAQTVAQSRGASECISCDFTGQFHSFLQPVY